MQYSKQQGGMTQQNHMLTLTMAGAQLGCKLIIMTDSICAIEERRHEKVVRVYTMDGFWYDVQNSIDDIYKKLSWQYCTNKPFKKERLRKMKAQSPSTP